MGYEVYYNSEKDTWSIWSTIISDWIGIGLKSPEEVADYVIETYEMRGRMTELERANVRRIWVEEAIRAKTEKREYVELLYWNLETGEKRIGVKKAP